MITASYRTVYSLEIRSGIIEANAIVLREQYSTHGKVSVS